MLVWPEQELKIL